MLNLLDFIFPKFCVNCKKMGDYLCPGCFSRLSFDTKNICLVCGKPSFDGLTHPKCKGKYSIEGSFSGIVFNSISKKLIYQFKYKPYLSSLSKFLGELLYESLIQNEEFIRHIANSKWFIVPIPLSSKRFKKRGYNQSEILAKELSKKFDFSVLNCLIRTRETKTQVGLTKEKRKENISGAFALNEKYRSPFDTLDTRDTRGTLPILAHKNIILIDDVLTSGATISEACNVLKRAGSSKVWAVAFAKED